MSSAIVCPGCRREFRNKPELAGKRIRCPKCNEPFVVPMPVEPLFDPWKSDSGMFALAASAPPPLPANSPPTRAWQPPPPLAYQSEFAVIPWTDNQRQCRWIGLRLGIFGAIGMVLPFMGFQFTILAFLGGYAILAALVVFLVGWCLFAGAYLSRTRWCGGNLAALKIGGVLAGGVVAVLVFLLGVSVVTIIAIRQFNRPAVTTLSTPVSITRVLPNGSTQTVSIPNPPANFAQPPAAQQFNPPPSNQHPNRAALGQLQAQLMDPNRPRPVMYGEGQYDLTLAVSGLDAIGGQHDWRIKQLLAKVTPLEGDVAGTGKGWSVSGAANDRMVTVIIRPVTDIDAAVRMIDFGTAQIDPTRPRRVTIKIDPAKFSPATVVH